MRLLKRAIEILRQEGIIALAKALLRYAVRPVVEIVYFLRYHSRILNFRHYGDLNELVDFVYNQCHGLIRPIQVRSEILELLTILDRTRPRSILEIGTANGGTLFLFTRIASEDAGIVSIDLPGGRYGGGYPRWKIPLYKSFALPGQAIHLIRADSHNRTTLEKTKAVLGDNGVDFLFIDGDHTYDGVKKDFEMYSTLVKKNGIIAFHDIVSSPSMTGCEVITYWNEIKSGYEHAEVVEDWNQGGAGIGLIKNA